MQFSYELLALIFLLVWLIVLTFLFYRYISHYNNLTKGVSSKSLKFILENIVKELQVMKKDEGFLKTKYDTIEKQGSFHIQKIGLIRFNPFKDTGGDQSFILSLLNGEDTGVVISSLYSRTGTRWYAKKVENGKGVEHELSEEETKAIKEAKK